MIDDGNVFAFWDFLSRHALWIAAFLVLPLWWWMRQYKGERAGQAERQLGDDEISQFTEPEAVERLVQRFLVRAQIAEVQTTTAGTVALTLLQGAATARQGLL